MARRRRRAWQRWLGRILVGAVVLVVGLVVVLFFYLRASIPDYDGTVTIAGLGAPATVVRDRNAVPHIFAADILDAYRALGYVHAQDRFFQMELNRRLGAGRLAEVFGAAALPRDRLSRVLNLYALAEGQVAGMAAEPLSALEAYAEGVNAWLSDEATTLPPEIVVLRNEVEPWRPADSVVWGKLMALRLSGNQRDDILRSRLANRLSAAQIADLWPGHGRSETVTAPELAAVYRELDLDRLARALAVGGAIASASNEWVVGGRFTQSGKPLLANDPHLRFTAPGLWYLARLVTPELEIAGGTVPGMPFTVVGHNANIAWGLTTTEADVQDLFIERLDPQDQGRYLTPGGAVPFTIRDEVIAIRGSDQPERLRVRETRHGPVISDIDPRIGESAPAGHVVALAFPALRPDDRTPEAVYWLNRATDWREFNRAMSMFHAPVQNLVYGDTSGRIGFLTPGRIPIRAAGDGRQLVPGWTGAFDWTGFIPFRRLPRLVDPPDARIVNANNRLVGGGYPYFITGDWPPSFRAERITQLLDETPQHSPASFAAIQNDAVSLAARELVPTFLALASAGLLSDQATAATALLADWHGLMARERPEPLIFVAWLRRLGQRLWSDELGPLAADYGGLRPRVIQNILADRTAWCDDVETATLETCADQVGAALEEALALLSERFGDEIEAWRWGEPHQAVFRHPVFGRQALLRRLTDIAIPSDGGPFTINRGVARLAEDDRMFSHIHGPGYRAIYDLGDLAESRFMVATGQSGHPLSPRYDDLTERWRDGAYIRLAGTADELRLDGIGVLTLEPAP